MGARHVTVKEVMSAPQTTDPDALVTEAARQLFEERIGSLVVVEDGEPVGIITETDVVGLVADGGPVDGVRVSGIMTSPLITTGPDDRLEDAAARMKEEGIKKLPVVADDAFVGMVTTTDISNYFPRYHPNSIGWIE